METCDWCGQPFVPEESAYKVGQDVVCKKCYDQNAERLAAAKLIKVMLDRYNLNSTEYKRGKMDGVRRGIALASEAIGGMLNVNALLIQDSIRQYLDEHPDEEEDWD